MLGGRGDECCEKIKNLQSVPGLLASIVGAIFTDSYDETKEIKRRIAIVKNLVVSLTKG